MRSDESLDQIELRAVGVLVLVDLHMVETPLMLFEHVGMLFKQPIRQQQQVVEIDRAGGLQNRLIFL